MQNLCDEHQLNLIKFLVEVTVGTVLAIDHAGLIMRGKVRQGQRTHNGAEVQKK